MAYLEAKVTLAGANAKFGANAGTFDTKVRGLGSGRGGVEFVGSGFARCPP